MKKNVISLAVAATVVSGAAVAGMSVSPDKTGQVLMFPMYNADNGNATNFHIVNTTAAVKEVKVRFVEYKNSDEVLDFNLYLSKHDHFAFGVIKDPNGTGAAVITADNSCTVPALGSANGAFSGTATTNADGSITRIQPFVNYQYANKKAVDSSIERTLTGHVEIIEMGVITDVSADPKSGKAYAQYATHGATGVPSNCAGLEAAWASGAWSGTSPSTSGITAPAGGLYGLAYHINVDAAAAFGFEPTAVADFSSAVQHTNPGTTSPSIASGQQTATIYHGATGTDGYRVIDWGTGAGLDAINSILMTDSLSNDVMINPALGGQTDWVVTFPTKRQSVEGAAADVSPPFTDNFLNRVLSGSVYVEKPACEPVTIEQWDREEAFTANTNSFSPTPAQVTSSICNEVAIIAMGAAGTASALSASTGVINLGFPYTEGWQRIGFGTQLLALPAGTETNPTGMKGLPAIGFAAFKVNNGAMSYGNAAEHKTATSFSGTVDE